MYQEIIDWFTKLTNQDMLSYLGIIVVIISIILVIIEYFKKKAVYDFYWVGKIGRKDIDKKFDPEYLVYGYISTIVIIFILYINELLKFNIIISTILLIISTFIILYIITYNFNLPNKKHIKKFNKKYYIYVLNLAVLETIPRVLLILSLVMLRLYNKFDPICLLLIGSFSIICLMSIYSTTKKGMQLTIHKLKICSDNKYVIINTINDYHYCAKIDINNDIIKIFVHDIKFIEIKDSCYKSVFFEKIEIID